MEIAITQAGNTKGNNVNASDKVFSQDFNQTLVHQVVTAYLAGARQGSKAQKNRSAVQGGGRKPWRQKGTGRARSGTIRSPIWRSGGVTFAAQPRDYSQKINKSMYRSAMRSIFSELHRQDRLIVLGDFLVELPKTKSLLQKLSDYEINPNVLIITDKVESSLYLASRNIPYVSVTDAAAADPVSLISYDKVIITVEALNQIEARLS